MADEPVGVETPPESDLQDEQTSSEEFATLQARNEQAESYIDELKGNQGTLMQKITDLEKQAAVTDARIDEQRSIITSQPPEETVDVFAMEDEALDEFRSDPAKLLPFLKEREQATLDRQSAITDKLVTKLVEVLTDESQTTKQSLQEIRELVSKNDVDNRAWSAAVEELKKNESFSALPDDTLIAIAKEKGMEPDYTFQGAVGQAVRSGSNGEKGIDMPVDQQIKIHRNYLVLYDNDEKRADRATLMHLKNAGVKNLPKVTK